MFRAIEFAILAILGLVAIAFLAPQQLPLVLYKATLVFLGCYLGYWADRVLFPYARPDVYATGDMSHASRLNAAMIRRAVIVVACVLGLTLGL